MQCPWRAGCTVAQRLRHCAASGCFRTKLPCCRSPTARIRRPAPVVSDTIRIAGWEIGAPKTSASERACISVWSGASGLEEGAPLITSRDCSPGHDGGTQGWTGRESSILRATETHRKTQKKCSGRREQLRSSVWLAAQSSDGVQSTLLSPVPSPLTCQPLLLCFSVRFCGQLLSPLVRAAPSQPLRRLTP